MQNHSITSQILTITPQLATDILKGNMLNRPLNKVTVDDYANQMTKGLWKLNGEPIIVAKDGTLLDGQHRLQAVIQSGCTITAVVIYNVDRDSFSTIDTGRLRTAGDIFSIEGVANAAQKAAAISSYKNIASHATFGITDTKSLRSIRCSKQETLSFYNDNADLVTNCVNLANQCEGTYHLMSRSLAAGIMLHLILDKKHPYDTVREFFQELYDLLPVTNPIVKILRNALLRHTTKVYVLPIPIRNIYIIKTWNAYITNKHLTKLMFDKNREKNIQFI